MTQPLILTSKVARAHAGLTLLEFLCRRFLYRDEEGWKGELAEGRLTLNARPAHGGERLQAGDVCAYTSLREEPYVNRDVRVLFEDEFLLFVNKPAPLPSHADGVFVRHTLVHLARELCKNPNLYLGHRLDRETSGVMAMAKDKVVLGALMPMFEQGKVKKTYLALVKGEPKDSFEVSGGIDRDPASEISMRWKLFTDGKGKPSRTLFRVKRRLKGRALLECEPLTGRTNQIRVHLEAAGHPIVGDKLYGRPDSEFLKFLAHVKAGGDSRYDVDGAQRHMLHAASLELIHPIKETPLKIEAPLPGDFAPLLL